MEDSFTDNLKEKLGGLQMKKYLEENGSSLLFWMRDVMDENAIRNLPVSDNCANILSTAVANKSFEAITEVEAEVVLKEFVEPVTYKDIDLLRIDPFYADVHNCCGKLWMELPSAIKNKIYGNK